MTRSDASSKPSARRRVASGPGSAPIAVRAAADSTHVGWSEVRLRPDPDGGGVPGFAGDTGWTIDVKGSGRTGWVELPTGAYRVHATGPGGLRSPEESLRLDLGDETEIELWLESS